MAEMENSKDLISVLWNGADILRSKMDANEYKDYLLGIVFYKYLSDSFLIRVYDLLNDDKPENLKDALEAYKEALADESAEELKEQIKSECHYVIEPELTYTFLQRWQKIILALIKYTGNVDYQYLYQALQTNCVTSQLSTGMDGRTQKFVSLKKIRELDIPFPKEQEQQKIGAYFCNLDNLITLHQRKCDELRKMKKFMLQNMFPKD